MIDELRVEYPCDPALRSVGRVAAIGVLLRLRMPMMAVEQFRSELDKALTAAAGDAVGHELLRVHVAWDEAEISVEISGPAGSTVLTRPRVHR